MFQGVIIKETLTDELVLDNIEIEKVELWKTNETPKYWTVVFFKSDV
jgi:hypothetical protein